MTFTEPHKHTPTDAHAVCVAMGRRSATRRGNCCDKATAFREPSLGRILRTDPLARMRTSPRRRRHSARRRAFWTGTSCIHHFTAAWRRDTSPTFQTGRLLWTEWFVCLSESLSVMSSRAVCTSDGDQQSYKYLHESGLGKVRRTRRAPDFYSPEVLQFRAMFGQWWI